MKLPKNSFVLSVVSMLMFISCQNKYNPDNYFKPEEQKELTKKIAVYTEKKQEEISYEDRFLPEQKAYYDYVTKRAGLKLKYLTKTDSGYYFLLTKKELKSLYEHYRAEGGFMKLNGDSIVYMDILFVTPMLKSEELEEKSEELFNSMAKTGSVKPWIDNLKYIEWPNKNVLYNPQTSRWYFPEGSEYKKWEPLMSNQN